MNDKPPSKTSPLSTPEPWDLVSGAYTTDLLEMFLKFAGSALDMAGVGAGTQVLDVATGPGTLALLAAKRGAVVKAIDFSPRMIAELERRRSEQGANEVEVHLGDAQRLPFGTDRFDAAFSLFGLMFFPDRGAGFREISRVLRPGGQAVVASWAPFTGAFGLVMESLQAELPDIPFGASKAPLSVPEEIIKEMRGGGFEAVTVTPVDHAITLPSAARFWESCERASAPVVLLQQSLGDSRWGEVSTAVRKRLVAALGTGPVEDTARAFLARGTKPLGD
jgi:SAM-dependent methyltransferase